MSTQRLIRASLNPIERVRLHVRERFLSQGIHLTCDDDVDAAWRTWNVCSPPPLGLSHRLLKAHQSVITESGIADRFFLFKKDLEGAAKSRDVPTCMARPRVARRSSKTDERESCINVSGL